MRDMARKTTWVSITAICLLASLTSPAWGRKGPSTKRRATKPRQSEVPAIHRSPKALLAARSKLRAALTIRQGEALPAKLMMKSSELFRRMRAKGSMIALVDVRASASFQKVRIPGSLNINLAAVWTKLFLKGKRIVLVNEGYRLRPLISACRRLRRRGWPSAVVLAGGLAGWEAAGGKLAGNPREKKYLRRIPPAAYQADKDYRDVVVVLVGKVDDGLFTGAMALPEKAGPKLLARAIRQVLVPGLGRKKVLYVVVASQDVKLYDRLEKSLRRSGDAPVLYLAGGVDAYQRFLSDQTAVWTRSPKRNSSGSSSCPGCK